jgi:uncharacterized protein YehS (DUF1456 family)
MHEMNNYCLRRLRYAFSFNDKQMLAIFLEMNFKLNLSDLQCYLLKEDDINFVLLPDYILTIFLDGFIQFKRGKREGVVELSQKERVELSKKERINNNLIVNKIKIALTLKAEDLISILMLADFRISKGELSAFFRKPEHRNYRECGNQFMRNLLTGITIKYNAKNIHAEKLSSDETSSDSA